MQFNDAIQLSSNTEHDTDILKKEFIATANFQLLSLVGLLYVIKIYRVSVS